MRKPGQNIEAQPPVEATKELSKDNLKAIEDWLSYLRTLAEAKEHSADPMQKDLLAKYQESWSKFLTNAENPDEGEAKVSEEQMAEITTAIDDWHQKEIQTKLQTQKQVFGERIYLDNIDRILDKTGLFSRREIGLVLGFYLHDSRHVSTDLHFTSLLYRKSSFDKGRRTSFTIDKQSRDQFEQQLKHFSLSVNLSAYPEEWLYQLIVQRTRERLGPKALKDNPELGTKLDHKKNTTDTINEIAFPVALALQRRFPGENYEIAINPEAGNEPKASAIIIRTRLKKKEIPVDPAILTSLIYNLAKNAGKAIYAHKSDNPTVTKPYKLEIEINEDEKGWSFLVADTGIGLETDTLLKQAGWAVKQATPEELKIYQNIAGKQAIKTLQDWISKNNSLRVRNLKLGQVWDFAKLPRLSGFDKRGVRESSGFGLYGADYLAKNHGGDIVGANRFDQGAVFVIQIPKGQKEETQAA